MRHANAALGILLALPTAAATATYAELAPLLAERCVVCHAGDSAAAGLKLDSLEGVLQGSAKRKVVQAGEPAGSELIRRLRGSSQPRMPMTGPPFLADAEIARFEQWIAAGMPAGKAGAAQPAPSAPASRPAPGEVVTYAHVAPLFARHCAKCHTDNGILGAPPEGYKLTSHAATVAAAERARVVPGHPQASELLRRVRGQARPRMPLGGPYLDDADIALVEAWIAGGARDAEGRPAPLPAGARVRLHGTYADGSLDGLPLRQTASTRRDKAPANGDYSRVDARGEVVVERLRRR